MKRELDSNEFIQAHCKLCNKLFYPTLVQVECRIGVFTGTQLGESHFYCSDECKNSCVVYNFKPHTQTDPRSVLYKDKSEQECARTCQTNHLKQLQIDQYGYNFCEKCGCKECEINLHHTLPISLYGKEAISSAGHILLCKKCHTEISCE